MKWKQFQNTNKDSWVHLPEFSQPKYDAIAQVTYADTSKKVCIIFSTPSTVYFMYFSGFLVKGTFWYLKRQSWMNNITTVCVSLVVGTLCWWYWYLCLWSWIPSSDELISNDWRWLPHRLSNRQHHHSPTPYFFFCPLKVGCNRKGALQRGKHPRRARGRLWGGRETGARGEMTAKGGREKGEGRKQLFSSLPVSPHPPPPPPQSSFILPPHDPPLGLGGWEGRASLTLSLLRVINVKIPLQPHKKYDITQYGELDFS